MGLAFYIPVMCSIIGFVLAILGLFAGSTPGFMENYQVLMLNTSVLGRNYVPALDDTTTTKRGLGQVTVLADEDANVATASTVAMVAVENDDNGNDSRMIEISIADSSNNKTLQKRKLTLAAAEGVLAGMTAADAADDMAAVLGISEFYSLHVMNTCQGTFAPNATAVGSWFNVSECTSQLSAAQLNISATIDGQLSQNFVDGGSLARLGGSSSLQSALNRIPTLGLVLAVFYIVGAACAGLSVLLTGASVVTRAKHSRETVLACLAAASGSALSLLVAALVMAVAAKSTVQSINRLGKETIGMEAALGTKFVNLTWAAFAMMTASSLFWLRELHSEVKAAAAAAARKKASAK